MQQSPANGIADVTSAPERPAPASVAESEATAAAEAGGYHRDRLLASIALALGLILLLALPFALRAGAEFFLPVTAALVVAIALVPLLEWLERRGVPSALAAFFCVAFFLGLANVA